MSAPPPGAAPVDGTTALGVLAAIPAWLTAPADAARVTDTLSRHVPELADGSLVIEGCDPKLRLKADRPGWSVAYELDLGARIVEQSDGTETVRVVGSFVRPAPGPSAAAVSEGPFPGAQWRGRFPELGLELATEAADTALPSLGALTDPVLAPRLLQDAIRTGSHPDIAIRAATPDVRRYKPGSRCTVLYHLELEPGHDGPRSVVAKTYRGDKGQNAFDGMAALWSSGIPERGAVTLAEPLAYLPEQRVLVQACVPEDRTLKELAREAMADGSGTALAELRAAVVKTAVGLAELHGSGVTSGETVGMADERADVAELLDRLRPALPEVAGAAGSLLNALDPVDQRVPAEPVVPTHRSFRPAQVLLHGGDIAFIDFDGLCMAEPALDVALFRSALRDAGTRGFCETGSSGVGDREATLDTLDALCDEFLATYQAKAPVSATRVALWETLDVLTSVLHCWTKVKPERLAVRIALLDRHLRSGALAG